MAIVREITEQIVGVVLHQPAEVMSCKRTIGDDAGGAGAVSDFPGFSYTLARWQGFGIECFQHTPAPDALVKNRLEGERIEHRSAFDEFAEAAIFGVALLQSCLGINFLKRLKIGGEYFT